MEMSHRQYVLWLLRRNNRRRQEGAVSVPEEELPPLIPTTKAMEKKDGDPTDS